MATANNGVLDGIRKIGAKFRDLTIEGGLPGTPLGYRLRGATVYGPPQTGTWKAGDQVPDRAGNVWICTIGGTGLTAQWAAVSTRGVNVQSFGATGNGTTNDTLAIQAALNATPSGCSCWVPFTAAGYLCGALIIPATVRFMFDQGAKLTAPATLTAPWLVSQAASVHNGTAVIGGTFDASAITGTGCTAVIFFAGTNGCPNLRIQNNTIINAPQHGMQVGENNLMHSTAMKWITGNNILEHGLLQTGFGIYCDYVGNVLIDGNYCYTAGVDDNIECGHSGPAWLSVDAHIRCTNNYCVGGELQYPFSDYVEIVNNTVVNNSIQNDGNIANYVQIYNNRVYNASPGSQFAGISHWGSYGQICGNYVQVAEGNGIGGSFSHEIVCNNYITSTSTPSDNGYAIYPGGGGVGDIFTGNICTGNFSYGIYCPMAESLVVGNIISTFNGLQFNGISYTVVSGNNLNVGNIATLGTPGTGTVITGNSGGTPWGKYGFAASIAGAASLNIPAGTAPTAPVSGDMWNNGSSLYYYNGTSAQQISPPAAQVLQQIFTV